MNIPPTQGGGLYSRLNRVSSSIWGVILFSALVLAGLGVVLQQAISHERDIAYANALKTSGDAVLLDEVRIRSLLASMDKVILLVRREFMKNQKLPPTELIERLRSMEVSLDNINNLSVSNAEGDLVLSTAKNFVRGKTSVNIADREHFKVHQFDLTDKLYVGEPVQSRMTGDWVIPITRHLLSEDGAFMGTIFLSLPTELLSGPLTEVDMGKNGARALIGLDGITRLRIKDQKVVYGGDSRASQLFTEIKKNKSGSYKAIAAFDGVLRLISYRVLEPYGIVSVAASAIADIEDSYTNTTNRYIFATFIFGLLILTLSVTVILSILRQRRQLETQQRFNKLIELVPQIVANLDAERKITWVNRRAVDYVIGPGNKAPMGFEWVYTAIHPDDHDRLEQFFTTEIAAAHTAQFRECRLRKFDGEYRWFTMDIAPVFEDRGNLTSYLLTYSDIHDRKMSEERLGVLQKVEAIGLLTGGMAHDFNNLLAIIVGNLDLAISKVLTPQEVKRLSVAREAAHRGIGLVRSLLALASRQPLMPTLVNLGDLVERIKPLLHHAVGQKVRVQVCLPEMAIQVNLDEAGLEAAMLNLCVNAKDAMPQGGKLLLDVRSSADKAYLTIKDNGSGMTQEVLKRAIEPFFTTKEAGRGTGLGLSMVSGFIKQSGGNLHIESSPGLGTAIEITLPLARDANNLPHVLEPLKSSPIKGPDASSMDPKRILVVDDEPEICIFISEWLKDDGHTAVVANSAEDALILLGVTRFDIMLTDIMMPESMDGIELAERVAGQYPHIKILLMSGYSLATATSRSDLPWPLLVKPFGKADFEASMNDLFANSGLQPLATN